MKLDFKVLVHYHIQFNHKNIVPTSALAGASFFFLCVHYFGLTNLAQCGIGEIILQMILPMLTMVGFVVLLRGIRYGVTPVYGMIGAAYCLLLVIQAFSYGNIFGAIIAMLWYILTAAVCVFTTFGYISSGIYMLIAFLVPVLFRLVFVDIYQYLIRRNFSGFFTEAAMLCGLTAFGLLSLCLKAVPVKTHRRFRRR